MIKKFAVLLTGIVFLNLFAYAQTDSATSYDFEKVLFYDDFNEVSTDSWTLSSSGNGSCSQAEHDGRSTLAITKHDKTLTSHPSAKLNADIGSEYAVTANVKIEHDENAGPIKSFEYVYFTVSNGTSTYRLQWFYGSDQLILQKNGKQAEVKSDTKLTKYRKYDWNEYRFEVSKKSVKVFINGEALFNCSDSGLSDNTGAFIVSGAATYPKNVSIFTDNVTVTELLSAVTSEKVLFYDGFNKIDTYSWTLSSSGDGSCGKAEHDGRSTLAITKHDKTLTSHPSAKLNADIGSEYAVTANVKIEKNEDAGAIKSFEYVYFTVSNGTSTYSLQWFYGSDQLVLQKNGKQTAAKGYARLAGYRKYDWNEYRFEVSKKSIKVFINGKELISCKDSGLSDNTGTFVISGAATYPKNVSIFADNVMVTELPPDVIKVDPEYKCRITNDGKIRIECKIYGPEGRKEDTATLIGALYKDGVLKGTASQKVNVPSGGKSQPVFLEFEAEDLFHELDLKLMLWDSGNRLIPVGTGLTDSTGYFIEDFDITEGGTLLYDTDFSEKRPELTVMDGSCTAGGYRFEKLQGNDVLNIFGGYGKKGVNRKYGVLLPDMLSEYAMEVTVRAHRFLSETASIILNCGDDGSYYALTWTRGGFPDIYAEYPVQKFRLCRDGENDLIAPKFEEVMDDDAPFVPQTYRIYVLSDRILVYRKNDGTPLFSYRTDEPISEGQIGFMVSGAGTGNMRYYVDDLKVWSL